MRHDRPCILAICLSLVGAAAGPSTQPSFFDRKLRFLEGFRCSHYLHLAVQLQQLAPDQRAKRLREMAVNPDQASELFPICRMLFDGKLPGVFRRPTLGGADFVGSRPFDDATYQKWPLEPVALQDSVPILVVHGFFGSGGPGEEPAAYLEYCLTDCRWRETKFVDADPAHIRGAVEAFIAATPDLPAVDAAYLRRQAD